MRLGQGSRSRGPWWLWCVGLLIGIAILPGATCLKAEPPKVTQASASERKTQEGSGELRAEPPPQPLAPHSPAEFSRNQSDIVVIEMQITEIPCTSNSSMVLDGWLDHRNKSARELKFVKRSVPILSKLPYIKFLFTAFSENIRSVKSTEDYSQGFMDGKLEQVHPAIEPKAIRFAFLTEEERSQLFESVLPALNAVTISSPKIMTITGNTAMVQVGKELSTKSALKEGFEVTLSPVLVSSDQLNVDYAMSSTKLLEKFAIDELLSKDEAVRDLPHTLSTAKIGTSVQLPLGKTFAIVSQRGYKNAPYEMVVLKSFGWKETKEGGDNVDSSQH